MIRESAVTIVLVHGAFADGGSWAPVTERLLAEGHQVLVPPVFNRSLSGDAAYIRSFAEQINRPVLLVGHSYGGAVITVAGLAENVVGLVYVCAYALDEGESLHTLERRFPDSELPANIVYNSYPVDGTIPGIHVSVKIGAFPHVLAGGIPEDAARALAVSQRPIADVAFNEPAIAAAWKTKPGWGIVAKADRAINPAGERFSYERAGLRKIVELDSSHLAMLTHSAEVSELITHAHAEVSGITKLA